MTTAIHTTMLDVVQAVSGYTTSEKEVVATVAYLSNSGTVLLCGNFAGAKIDPSTPACTAPKFSSHRTLNSFQTVTVRAQQ